MSASHLVAAITGQTLTAAQRLRFARALASLERASGYFEEAADGHPELHGAAYAAMREAKNDLEVLRRELSPTPS